MKYGCVLTKDYNFFKGIIYVSQRRFFLFYFFFVNHFVCRLNIISFTTLIADKIDFVILSAAFAIVIPHLFGYDSDINTETSCDQFVVNNIFQEMRVFNLSEIQSYISLSPQSVK